jgi:hypothetical protein
MTQLSHTTDWYTGFKIWQSGVLEPQDFSGCEDSSLPEGEKVIFCFRLPRIFNGKDLLFVLPEVEAEEGVFYSTETVYGDCTSYKKHKETEYYVKDRVALKDCKVYRVLDDSPCENDCDPLSEFLSDYEYYTGEDVDVVYSNEGQDKAEAYLEWVKSLPVYSY